MLTREVLSPRVVEIVHGIESPIQQQEILRNAHGLVSATSRIASYDFPRDTTQDTRYDKPPKDPVNEFLPGIVSTFALQNFGIARENSFPGLSPERAMELDEIVVRCQAVMARSTARAAMHFRVPKRSIFEGSAVALVGLQAAILGDTALVHEENARELLGQAMHDYACNITGPLYRNSAQ